MYSTKQSLTDLPEHEAKGTARRKSARMTANVKQWFQLPSEARTLHFPWQKQGGSQPTRQKKGTHFAQQELILTHLLAHNHSTGCASIAGRNIISSGSSSSAALQEQADNLPRAGSFFSASCFHLCGQHQDWWLSLATGPGSVPTTLRRLPPKHCHHSQVLARQNSLPSKLCACCRWHSRAPSVSFLLLVHKQALPKATMPPQTMNRQRPMQILSLIHI